MSPLSRQSAAHDRDVQVGPVMVFVRSAQRPQPGPDTAATKKLAEG